MHAKATLSGIPLAETSTYEFVEGNVYFPPSSLKAKETGVEMMPTQHKTWCSWKGEASYVSQFLVCELFERTGH